MSAKPFDPVLVRRTATAQRVACALAQGKTKTAIAEAEMTGNGQQTLALSVLILQKQYGLTATERALKQLASA